MMRMAFVAAVALVVSVACGGGDAASDSTTSSDGTASATVAATTVATATVGSGDVFELKVGQCFDDPDQFENVTDLEMLACDEAHDNEVYALFDLPAGTFPGVSVIEDLAGTGCHDAFAGYVGLDYASSVLDFSWLAPTPRSWESGDQEVVCIVYDLDLKKLTDSVKDSAM